MIHTCWHKAASNTLTKSKNSFREGLLHVSISHLHQTIFISKNHSFTSFHKERGMAQLVNRKTTKGCLLYYCNNKPLKLFSNSTKILLEDCLNQMSWVNFFFFFHFVLQLQTNTLKTVYLWYYRFTVTSGKWVTEAHNPKTSPLYSTAFPPLLNLDM